MKDTKAWAVVSETGEVCGVSDVSETHAWAEYLSLWPEYQQAAAKRHREQFGYTTREVVIVSAERYAELTKALQPEGAKDAAAD